MNKETGARVIYVDLDKTLAHHESLQPGQDYQPQEIGEPIPEMVAKVKQAIASGAEVHIFTARVFPGDNYQESLDSTLATIAIAEWCKKYLGQVLPVTCMKSLELDEILDDKATQIVPNTGLTSDEFLAKAQVA